MKRDDYLRELETAGQEMSSSARDLAAAANPLTLLRESVACGWKWWLPGALAAGFLASQLMRPSVGRKGHGDPSASSSGGAAFWVPVVLKLLPAVTAQLMPLFLSLRSCRKP